VSAWRDLAEPLRAAVLAIIRASLPAQGLPSPGQPVQEARPRELDFSTTSGEAQGGS
jgi:hypothetical protein